MNRALKAKIIEKYGNPMNFSMVVEEYEPIISRIILGQHPIDPDRQQAWADALQCEVKEIFPDNIS